MRVPGCENNALINKDKVCAFSSHQGWQRTNQPDREGCLHAATARRDDSLVPVCMSLSERVLLMFVRSTRACGAHCTVHQDTFTP
jgi:hypothetical protein